MKKLLLLLLLLGCSGSAGGQERVIPLYTFDCRPAAVSAALAIEPYCGPLPVIHTGTTVDGLGHAEAFCEGLGYIRLIGPNVVGVYSSPVGNMTVERVFSVGGYLEYVFGWTMEGICIN